MRGPPPPPLCPTQGKERVGKKTQPLLPPRSPLRPRQAAPFPAMRVPSTPPSAWSRKFNTSSSGSSSNSGDVFAIGVALAARWPRRRLRWSACQNTPPTRLSSPKSSISAPRPPLRVRRRRPMARLGPPLPDRRPPLPSPPSPPQVYTSNRRPTTAVNLSFISCRIRNPILPTAPTALHGWCAPQRRTPRRRRHCRPCRPTPSPHTRVARVAAAPSLPRRVARVRRRSSWRGGRS